MADLETFRKEARAWLEENCPASMRTPMPEEEIIWGGRGQVYKNPDAKLWLDRMAARGWTAPTWPSEYGGGGLSKAEAGVLAQELKSIGARDLACVVAEPIQGEGGFIVPADGYLAALQEWCTANGVVFIADEIQSGMARTGRYYASEHFGVEPELVLTAKGIAGGLPVAAVTGRAEIMDAPHAGGLGGTFAGNSVAAAAAIAVFGEIERRNLLAEAGRIEAILMPALLELQAKHPIIGDVRGIGAMIAIELVQPGTLEPNPAAVAAITAFAAQHGVLLLSAGTFGNVIRFLPSLAISDELLRDAIGVLGEAFAAVGL